MIVEREPSPTKRRLDFDNVDNKQLEAFGKIELQRSVTSVRYKHVNAESIMNLFDDGDEEKAIRLLNETIKQFEKKIADIKLSEQKY